LLPYLNWLFFFSNQQANQQEHINHFSFSSSSTSDTMGSKEINIKFTQEQVKKYNDQGSRLCFSAGVGDVFNVIAYADSK
jgi:hypothetical protein